MTLNAGSTLQRCLDSIYMQRFKDIDIVVIDGKSTDNTVQIIIENLNHLSYWISEPDNGIYDAMNKALDYVTCDWVYFLGADDELLPDFTMFIESLENEEAIYYANVLAEGCKRLGHLSHYQIAKFGIYHQAIVFPAKLLHNCKYDLRYKISADYALLLKLAGKGVKFIYKDFTIANYNSAGISAKEIDHVFQNDKAMLIYKGFGFLVWLRYKIHKYKNSNNPRA